MDQVNTALNPFVQQHIDAILYKSYKKITRNRHELIWSFERMIDSAGNNCILFDTNIFSPVSANHFPQILETNMFDKHEFFNLEEQDMLEGAKNYKEVLCSILKKYPKITVTPQVFSELGLELNCWSNIQPYFEHSPLIMDDNRKDLINKLSGFMKNYILYLQANSWIEKILQSRMIRVNERKYSCLLEIINSFNTKSQLNDRMIVHDAIIYSQKEPVTLITEDFHLNDIGSNLEDRRLEIERIFDKRIIIRNKQNWHNYLVYSLGFEFFN